MVRGSLFYTDASPYARLVRICIRELDCGDIDEHYCHPFDNEPEHLTVNPLGKVPCLLIDGEALFDSTFICETLFEESEGNECFVGFVNRENKKLHYLAKGILDLAVFRQQEKLKSSQDEFWLQRTEAGISRSLHSINDQSGWLVEQTWGLSSATLVCALDYLSFRHPELEWQQLAPFLSTWLESQLARPSVIATEPVP